jgi:hypothetical protein
VCVQYREERLKIPVGQKQSLQTEFLGHVAPLFPAENLLSLSKLLDSIFNIPLEV